MRVQILGEALYWVDESYVPTFARLGRQLMEALYADDPLLFSIRLEELVQVVHAHGQPVPQGEDSVPDLEIPPPELLFSAAL